MSIVKRWRGGGAEGEAAEVERVRGCVCVYYVYQCVRESMRLWLGRLVIIRAPVILLLLHNQAIICRRVMDDRTPSLLPACRWWR